MRIKENRSQLMQTQETLKSALSFTESQIPIVEQMKANEEKIEGNGIEIQQHAQNDPIDRSLSGLQTVEHKTIQTDSLFSNEQTELENKLAKLTGELDQIKIDLHVTSKEMEEWRSRAEEAEKETTKLRGEINQLEEKAAVQEKKLQWTQQSRFLFVCDKSNLMKSLKN